MPPSYPFPWKKLPGLAKSVLSGGRRSFREDSLYALSLLNPPCEFRGRENIPYRGPYLVTSNHYSREGFQTWWISLAISAALPVEVHWIMTGAWIYLGKVYEAPMRRLSTWLFGRLALVYGFTTMPPVAPYSMDTEGRASSVRQILAYARRTPGAVIGLAPEGTDFSGGVLGTPPPGAGRFIAHLARSCQIILPVGIFEEPDHLCARFGEPYRLEVPGELSPDVSDAYVSAVVMHALASQLPASLRGKYG